MMVTSSGFTSSIGTKLSVEVTNLANNDGYVLISLYNNAGAFPDNAEKAVKNAQVKIKDGRAVAAFDLEAGEYAIAILHDENNNLKMDFNMLGMPIEGYGFSNDAKGTLGPPSFKKASFSIQRIEKKVIIKTSYLLR